MKRRDFIRKAGFAAGVPIAFHGVPLKLMASHQNVERLAAESTNDRVLVILQMHGGNDGLNSFVPLDNYDHYYSRRANIALPYKSGRRTVIPLDSTVASADQIGLHPDMQAFKDMYDLGRAAVFQGVSYERNNGSHFRGRDIQFMGGGADDYLSSGWIGRYLNTQYDGRVYPEEFPYPEMLDPLALEMGNDLSLIFHQTGNIPTSISLAGSPTSLANQIDGLEGFTDEGVDPRGTPPEFLDDTPYGKQMNWILGLEDKSEDYIKRLSEIYDSAAESKVEYPNFYPFNAPDGSKSNGLSGQLQLVARLLDGGVKTKVFLVKIGGFDTHANQTESYDPTMGSHAALMYHISNAMKAFNSDLISRGLDHRVLALTMSEFGRRIGSNGSYGTDHGTGGPVMMFGTGVKPGIYGTSPDLSENNVGMQFDYRQIYANILHEWMEVDQQVIANDIFFGDYITGPDPNGNTYETMDLIKEVITSNDNYLKSNFKIDSLYPNPASSYTQVNLVINDKQTVNVEIIDINGRVVMRSTRQLSAGKHTISFQLDKLIPGIYFVKAKSEKLNDTKRLLIRK